MNPSFLVITPAYNEEKYLPKTIEGMLAQTTLPDRWIIVDDGSTDQTGTIIEQYARQYPWISYIRRNKDPSQTYYASNVYAIQEGLRGCKEIPYDYLAILDADISIPSDYYERIFRCMAADEKLGIASGIYVDNINGKLRKVMNDRRSTPKALMVFRRQCFEEVGGFLPMRYGGEDTCACFTARMKGWKTWSFLQLRAIHNKPVGTGNADSLLKIRFKQGVGEYHLAVHPLFFLLKSVRRCFTEPPFLLGGMARVAGYLRGYFMRQEKQMPDALVRYVRWEHLHRIFEGNQIPDRYRVDVVP